MGKFWDFGEADFQKWQKIFRFLDFGQILCEIWMEKRKKVRKIEVIFRDFENFWGKCVDFWMKMVSFLEIFRNLGDFLRKNGHFWVKMGWFWVKFLNFVKKLKKLGSFFGILRKIVKNLMKIWHFWGKISAFWEKMGKKSTFLTKNS